MPLKASQAHFCITCAVLAASSSQQSTVSLYGNSRKYCLDLIRPAAVLQDPLGPPLKALCRPARAQAPRAAQSQEAC